MPQFSYRAKKGPKEIVDGIIEAPNKEAVVTKLNQMGFVPISVREAAEKERMPVKPAVRSIYKRVRSKDIAIFTAQLASLIKSKVQLLEAIDILNEQTQQPHLKEIITNLGGEIKDGRTLSDAMSRYPRVFSSLYINMIRSGESAGVLEEALVRLANFAEKEEEMKAKITSSLVYPFFIVIVGLATVFYLITFVIPQVTALFDQIGQKLPLPTRMLIFMSNKVKHYWYVIVLAIVGAIVLFKRRSFKEPERIIFDRFKLKLPFVGDFLQKSVLARFSRTLGVLLANGIPLFRAIEIATPTVDNEIYKRELQKIYKDIIDGLSVQASMRKSSWFPPFMVNMFGVGEKTGNLQDSLQEIANFYEREVDRALRIMTSMLEPFIILVMGLAVGFVVFAMLLPIFEMNLAVK